MITFISFLCILLLFLAVFLLIKTGASTNNAPIKSTPDPLDDDYRMIKAADDFWGNMTNNIETHNAWMKNRDLEKRIDIALDRKRINERLASLSSENPATSTSLVRY